MRAPLPPFQRLIDLHGEHVFRYLVAIAGPSEADDCWQETFLAALRVYPDVRPDSNLRAWLFTIARNKAMDAHRSRQRRPVPASVPDRAASATSFESAVPELWAAVDGLSPKQRTAVLHRYVGDLPYADIGEAMGVSPEAARRNVFEGLKKLREVWDD